MARFSSLIIVLLVIAFLLRVDFIFYVVYVCIGIYAWSRWYSPRILHSLSIERIFDDHAFWGNTVPVTIRLQNTSRLPLPWVQFTESVAVELTMRQRINQVLSLRSRETAEFIYHVKARRRGYYRLGPLFLKTGDLFGFFEEQRDQVPASYLTVYPRLIPLTQLGLPSRLPFGTIASHQRLFEDPARPMGVRDYHSGDSLRQINWKVSAHTRTLVVKTFQPAVSLETAVLLNLYADDYRRNNRQVVIEWAIEVAASLAAHLVDKRQPVGLMTNGADPLQSHPVDQADGRVAGGGLDFDESSGRLLMPSVTADQIATIPSVIPPRPGRAHLMKILEKLARIEAGGVVPFDTWAPTAGLHLNWGVTLLAVTAKGDEATCQTLHRLVRAGFNPILVVVEPTGNFGEVRQRARQLGFTAYKVAQEYDLDRWRQRQGVPGR